jgi:hypothetical protein
MLTCVLTYAVILADPVSVIQLRYPAKRTTITTASGYTVVYTLAADAPAELQRAYKVLEIAEREVLITEALQMLRAELVANERRLESLRTARLAAYLTDTRSGPQFIDFDPAVVAPPESRLKFKLGNALAKDAKVERALLALERLADAHYRLHQTLIALAYPDRRPAAGTKLLVISEPVTKSAVPTTTPNRPGSVVEAEKVEKATAEAELLAEERERDARLKERAADVRYRDSLPADRPAARAAWLKARDSWEEARRDWDAARQRWQTARDQLDALRKASGLLSTEPAARPVLPRPR